MITGENTVAAEWTIAGKWTMDELVTVGVAGISGLVLIAIVLVGAVFWIGGLVIAASSAGDWHAITVIFGILAIILAAYAGTGFWLQKTGRI